MTDPNRPPWYRNTRGEWYVVAQLALIALSSSAAHDAGPPPWPASITKISIVAGIVLMTAAHSSSSPRVPPQTLAYASPSAEGRHDARHDRPYRLVRHPIFAGVLVLTLGSALLVRTGSRSRTY